MKTTLLLAALLVLSGCSMLPAAVGEYERQAADTVVDSSERAICVVIPIGTWVRRYGKDAARRAAWRALCEPAVATPTDPVLP